MSERDKQEVAQTRAVMAAVQYDALNNAVRALADRVNEHTIMWIALCKKLGITPAQLTENITPEDFVNPADNKLIEGPDASGT